MTWDYERSFREFNHRLNGGPVISDREKRYAWLLDIYGRLGTHGSMHPDIRQFCRGKRRELQAHLVGTCMGKKYSEPLSCTYCQSEYFEARMDLKYGVVR